MQIIGAIIRAVLVAHPDERNSIKCHALRDIKQITKMHQGIKIKHETHSDTLNMDFTQNADLSMKRRLD